MKTISKKGESLKKPIKDKQSIILKNYLKQNCNSNNRLYFPFRVLFMSKISLNKITANSIKIHF